MPQKVIDFSAKILNRRYIKSYDNVTYEHVKEDEMGRACSMNGGEDESMWDIDGKARRKETTGKTMT
jgi:hypothetical protein